MISLILTILHEPLRRQAFNNIATSLDEKMGGLPLWSLPIPSKNVQIGSLLRPVKYILYKVIYGFHSVRELCGEQERGLSNGSGKLKCPDFKLFDWVHWAQPIIRFRMIKKTNTLWFGSPFTLNQIDNPPFEIINQGLKLYLVVVSKRLLFFFEMHQINLSNGTICNWSSINNSSLLLILGCIIC